MKSENKMPTTIEKVKGGRINIGLDPDAALMLGQFRKLAIGVSV